MKFIIIPSPNAQPKVSACSGRPLTACHTGCSTKSLALRCHTDSKSMHRKVRMQALDDKPYLTYMC